MLELAKAVEFSSSVVLVTCWLDNLMLRLPARVSVTARHV